MAGTLTLQELEAIQRQAGLGVLATPWKPGMAPPDDPTQKLQQALSANSGPSRAQAGLRAHAPDSAMRGLFGGPGARTPPAPPVSGLTGSTTRGLLGEMPEGKAFIDPETEERVQFHKDAMKRLDALLDEKSKVPPVRRFFKLLPNKDSPTYQKELEGQLAEIDRTAAFVEEQIHKGQGANYASRFLKAQPKLAEVRADIQAKLDEVTGAAAKRRRAESKKRVYGAAKTGAKFTGAGAAAIAAEAGLGLTGGVGEQLGLVDDAGLQGTVLDRMLGRAPSAGQRVLAGAPPAAPPPARTEQPVPPLPTPGGRGLPIDPGAAPVPAQDQATPFDLYQPPDLQGLDRYLPADEASPTGGPSMAVPPEDVLEDFDDSGIMDIFSPAAQAATITNGPPVDLAGGDPDLAQRMAEDAQYALEAQVAEIEALKGVKKEDVPAIIAVMAAASTGATLGLKGARYLGSSKGRLANFLLATAGIGGGSLGGGAAGFHLPDVLAEQFGMDYETADAIVGLGAGAVVVPSMLRGAMSTGARFLPALAGPAALPLGLAAWAAADPEGVEALLLKMGVDPQLLGPYNPGGQAEPASAGPVQEASPGEMQLPQIQEASLMGGAQDLFGQGMDALREYGPQAMDYARENPELLDWLIRPEIQDLASGAVPEIGGALGEYGRSAADTMTWLAGVPESARDALGLTSPPADEPPVAATTAPAAPATPATPDVAPAAPPAAPEDIPREEAVAEARKAATTMEPDPGRVTAAEPAMSADPGLAGDAARAAEQLGFAVRGGQLNTDPYGAPGTFRAATDASVPDLTQSFTGGGAAPSRDSGATGGFAAKADEAAEAFEPNFMGRLFGVESKDEQRDIGLALLAAGGDMMSSGDIGQGLGTFARGVVGFDQQRRENAKADRDTLLEYEKALYERDEDEEDDYYRDLEIEREIANTQSLIEHRGRQQHRLSAVDQHFARMASDADIYLNQGRKYVHKRLEILGLVDDLPPLEEWTDEDFVLAAERLAQLDNAKRGLPPEDPLAGYME